VIFFFGIKQRLAADDAFIHSGIIGAFVLAGKWRLGVAKLCDAVLLIGEPVFEFFFG
jgi:hypothetical protein